MDEFSVARLGCAFGSRVLFQRTNLWAPCGIPDICANYRGTTYINAARSILLPIAEPTGDAKLFAKLEPVTDRRGRRHAANGGKPEVIAEEELSVTHLRQIMLEELRCRNYAESTIHTYIDTVEHFSRHCRRSPDQLGPEHIRQYQAALFTRWKLAPNTVTERLEALRFFYVQVLKRGWSVAETPYPKEFAFLQHFVFTLGPEQTIRLQRAAMSSLLLVTCLT
jgi:hypothetical protein